LKWWAVRQPAGHIIFYCLRGAASRPRCCPWVAPIKLPIRV